MANLKDNLKAETRNQKAEMEAGEELLDALVTYCLTAGPPWCYREWTPALLKGYLLYHSNQGTLAWVDRNNGKWQMANGKPEVCGCGVAWQCDEKEIRRAEREGRHVFEWKATNPKGDALFFADFICSGPGVLKAMIAEFDRRFPKWSKLKWFTYRKQRLVRLNGTKFPERFFKAEIN